MTPLPEAEVVLVPVCEAVRTGRLDGKGQKVHDDWGCVLGIGGIGHPHWSVCHVGEAR